MLDKACRRDAELRAEVEAMLEFDEQQPEFLSSPAICAEQAPTDAATPRSIGRFRVLRRIGEGSMGAVFEVEQDRPPRVVALKLLRPGLAQTQALRRFELEGEILGRLQHPGIARIFESGSVETESGPQPYLAMELVAGETLTTHARKHQLGVRERLELLARVCDAVQHAHQNGVIHRDLKPANVLVEDSGQVKILDFGIARLVDADVHLTALHTGTGQIIGTLAYMSPEQASGEPGAVDTRSDVYSLGVMLHELLSGDLPYDVSSSFLPDAIQVIREREPRKLSTAVRNLRGDIETITRKALEKDRERRYASAAALAADIHHFLDDEPIEARPASRVYTLRKFVRRNRTLVSAAALVFLALTAGLIVSLSFGLAEARERARAERMTVRARLQAYQSGMLAAKGMLDAANLQSTLNQLDSLPEEHRGWGWAALDASARPLLAQREIPDLLTAALIDDTTALVIDEHGAGFLWDAALDTVEELGQSAPNARPLALSRDGQVLFSYAHGELLRTNPFGSRVRNRARAPIAFPHGEPHADWRLAATSDDGSRLALVTETGELHLVDPLRDPMVRRLVREGVTSSAHPPRWLRLSPDGSLLAMGKPFSLWDIATAEFLWTQGTRRGTLGAYDCAFDMPGGRILTGLEDGLRFLDLEDGRTLETWGADKLDTRRAGPAFRLEFDRSGTRIAVNFRGGGPRILDAASGELTLTSGVRGGRMNGFAIARNGDSFLAWSRGRDTVTLAKMDRRLGAVLEVHETVYPLVVSPDGSLVATGGWEGNTRIWDPVTGAELARLYSAGKVQELAFSSDGNCLAAGLRKGGLVVWAPHSGECLHRARKLAAAGLAYNPSGTRLAIGDMQGNVRLIDTQTYETVHTVRVDDERVNKLAFSPDGRLLAVSTQSGFLSLRDSTSLAEISNVHGERRGAREQHGALSLAFSPDGSRLVTGWGSSELIIYGVPSLDTQIVLLGHQSEVFSVAFSPDGRRIASGGRDGVLRLWDSATGGLLLGFDDHRSFIYSLAFTPDGRRIATGSGDGTVRIWDSAPRATSWRERVLARRAQGEVELRRTQVPPE